YQNDYRGVFPIKVNQLREVVEEIVDAGEQFHFGLEAGSKPELVAALAMQKGPKTLIICNGYKDPAFIRLALLGRKLGKPVVIVAEKLEEVEQIIRASKEVGVEPWIGIRARHDESGRGEPDVKGCRAGALPQTCSFPRRIAGARYFGDQARSPRRRAILREVGETWTRTWLS